MEKLICQNCGKEFTSWKPNQKFCSVNCYREYMTKLSIQSKLKALEIMEKERQKEGEKHE